MPTLAIAIEKIRQLPPEQWQKVIQFIEFLEYQSHQQQKNISTQMDKENQDFFELAGIWENKDITTESLRLKAWSRDR